MTIFEKIKSMNYKELSKFLIDNFNCNKITDHACDYCEVCLCEKYNLEDCPIIEVEVIEKWLNKIWR